LVACNAHAEQRAVAPPDSPTVRLVDDTADDGATSTIILTGAIGDYGTATTLDDLGNVDATQRTQWRLDLHHGAFRIDIQTITHRLAAAFADNPINQSTCSGHVEVSAPAPIVPDSGTGAYTGIAGHFDLTITIDEVVQGDPPTCDATDAIASQSVHTTGLGSTTN